MSIYSPVEDMSGQERGNFEPSPDFFSESSCTERERALLSWQVETLGELACARAALSGESWDSAESKVLQQPVKLADGRVLEWRVFRGSSNDEAHRELTRRIMAGRASRYVAEGHWNPDAVDDLVGADVEMLALVHVDSETSEEKPLASMRIIHGPIGELPSFKKAIEAGALSTEGLQLIADGSMREAPDGTRRSRPAVELGALWKGPKVPIDVTTAMYRMAFHLSVIRDERWVIGAVPKEVIRLDTFGPEVIHHVGVPYEVHDGNAKNGLMLAPLYVDPSKVLLGFAEQARQAACQGDHDGVRRNRALITRFARGLDMQYLDDATRAMLMELVYEHQPVAA